MGIIMVHKPTYNWGGPSCTRLYVHAMIIPSHHTNPITDDRLRFRIPPTVLAARRAANEAYWVGHPSFDLDFGGTLSDYSGLMDFNEILMDINGF